MELNSDGDKRVLSAKNIASLKNKIEIRKAEVELPELNEILGLADKETAIVIVRQLEMSEFLKIKIGTIDYAKNLVDGIVEAVSDKSKVKESVAEIWGEMAPESRERIDVVESGLVEPKLSRADIVYLSKMFPMVITKLYVKIIELTTQGASLKKNSSSS
jgi:hypothetical protein